MWRTAVHPAILDRHAAAEAAKKAFLLALLVHLFAMVALPEYTVTVKAAREVPIEPIPLPPQIDIPHKDPPTLPRPSIPVEVEDDADVPTDATIEPTILDQVIAAIVPVGPVHDLPAYDEFRAYDTKPDFIRHVKPDYPQMARTAGIEGTVIAQLLIGTNGTVLDVRIVSGPEILHESVRAAAMASLFSPALQRDKPVAVWVAVPYHFMLREAP